MSDTPTSPGTPNEPEAQDSLVSPDSPPEVSDAINEHLDKHDAFTPDPGERPVAAVASDKDAIVELSGKVEEIDLNEEHRAELWDREKVLGRARRR